MSSVSPLPKPATTHSPRWNCHCTYLAKVHFIKDNLIRMPDAPETSYESKHRDDRDGQLVVPFGALLLGLIWLHPLECSRDLLGGFLGECLDIWRSRALLVLRRALPHLALAAG